MQIFAKRFYGFDPGKQPFVAFGLEGNRDALISASVPGDRIVFVGTQGEPTPKRERGRLLGIAEFARVAVDVENLIDLSTLEPYHFGASGALVWPKALPITRAWGFEEPLLELVDVLKEQLTFEATIRAVLLDDSDSRAVLAIPRVELPVRHFEDLDRLRALNDAVAPHAPTTGPVPAPWNGNVSRDPNSEAWTYAMKFGRRDLWKVGHTQDVAQRLREVNLHVPHEEIGERWVIVLTQRWRSSQDAYAMEQRIFKSLEGFRTEGERVKCTAAELEIAWARSIFLPDHVLRD